MTLAAVILDWLLEACGLGAIFGVWCALGTLYGLHLPHGSGDLSGALWRAFKGFSIGCTVFVAAMVVSVLLGLLAC